MVGYNEPMALVEQNEDFHSPKYYLTCVVLAVVFLIGGVGAVLLAQLPPTFNGKVDVAQLQQNPTAYSTADADGAAYVIVAENLDKTNALNVCFSVVFNFRGYDTMGESFILIAALAGSLCILRTPKHGAAAGEAEATPQPVESVKDATAAKSSSGKKRAAAKAKRQDKGAK